MRSLLLVLCVIVAGCATARVQRPDPDRLVVVFADDFHSGIVLAHGDVPANLLPGDVSRPWVAVHFGEREWITGQASGMLAGMALAVDPGPGGVQIDNIDWWVHDRGGSDRQRLRVWVFPVTAGELAGLQARLASWIDSGPPGPIRPGSCWWPSRHNWSLRTNCHDFTVDLLAGAGILVARPPIMMAGPLRDALDAAWAGRDAGR